MRYFILFLFFSAAFWACQPDEACISSATNRLVLQFYVQTDTTPVRDTLQFTKIRSISTPEISFLEKPEVGVTSLILVLNPDQDTTAFIFGRPNLPDDTLVLRYQRRYRLIAPDCPLEVSFRELQVVNSFTSFDSVQVVNTELLEPSDNVDVQIIFPQR